MQTPTPTWATVASMSSAACASIKHDRYRKASGTVRRWELRTNGREVLVEVDGGLIRK